MGEDFLKEPLGFSMQRDFYSMRQNVIIDQTPPSLTQTCLTGYYIE